MVVMKMMSGKEKKLLNKVKTNAFKLKGNGQIPYSLYHQVLLLNYESSIDDVNYLMDMCEKYTRVGGFYIRHADGAIDCDKELAQRFK